MPLGIPQHPPTSGQDTAPGGKTHYLQCQVGMGPLLLLLLYMGDMAGHKGRGAQPAPGWDTRLEGARGQLWVALGGLCQQRGLLLVCPEELAPWDSWRGDISSCPPCLGEDRAGTHPWESHRFSGGGRTWQESLPK